mmetsp:Transcript_7955/g.31412  ORF Transcript_7955/g.31412 Transcript_7955/m.31412 type:complete len:207 (+) Transcript_7955:857-1477(+)
MTPACPRGSERREAVAREERLEGGLPGPRPLAGSAGVRSGAAFRADRALLPRLPEEASLWVASRAAASLSAASRAAAFPWAAFRAGACRAGACLGGACHEAAYLGAACPGVAFHVAAYPGAASRGAACPWGLRRRAAVRREERLWEALLSVLRVEACPAAACPVVAARAADRSCAQAWPRGDQGSTVGVPGVATGGQGAGDRGRRR